MQFACFIDCYKGGGVYEGKLVVSVEEFLEKRPKQCDFVFVGPSKKGGIASRVKIAVCPLYTYWFVG